MGDLTIDGTMSLGSLIKAVEAVPRRSPFNATDNREHCVWIGLRGLAPRGFCSYRGDYSHLAIVITTNGDKGMDRALFLEELRAQIGAVHQGWKGGEYTMTADTPVWAVTHPGFSGSNAIVGVLWNNDEIVLNVETEFDAA